MSHREVFPYRLTNIIDHNKWVRELILVPEGHAGICFRSGQFFMLHVPPKPTLRAYSIASDERDIGHIRLLLKYVPTGIASEYVWSLKGGEFLHFTGPFGRLFFQAPPTQRVYFFNTGTGIAQHYSYLLSHAAEFPEVQYTMLFGVPTESDVYFREELAQIHKKIPNFHYEYVLSNSAAGAGNSYRTGYLHEQLDLLDFEGPEATFYLCGNRLMLCAVRDFLVSRGIQRNRIFCEAFE